MGEKEKKNGRREDISKGRGSVFPNLPFKTKCSPVWGFRYRSEVGQNATRLPLRFHFFIFFFVFVPVLVPRVSTQVLEPVLGIFGLVAFIKSENCGHKS